MSIGSINPPETEDILIVDDSVTALELLAVILGEAGYHVRSAASGEMALRSVQARQPALILLDIEMPGMDGFEVCRRLKEDALTRDIPVIFLSVHADTVSKLKGLELGAVDYMSKPFENREVLARVRVHMILHAAHEQLTNQVHQLQHAGEQLTRDIAEHERIKENLEAALKRLQTLNLRLSKGKKEERHKIAHELHEQLGQEIASLKMTLSLMKTKGIGKETQVHLLVAQSTAKVVLERIRSMSRNLRPEKYG